MALGVDPAQSRTNHPVLFVHGINSGMETWGAEVVDLAEQGCELAMDKVRIDVESKWSDHDKSGAFEHNHADWTLHYSAKVNLCGTDKELWSWSSPVIFSRDCGSLNKSYSAHCSNDLNTSNKVAHDYSLLSSPFYSNFSYTYTGSNGDGAIFHSFAMPKEQMTALISAVDGYIKVNSAKKVARFKPGHLPSAIQAELHLTPDPNTGMSKPGLAGQNGLYAYNALDAVASTVDACSQFSYDVTNIRYVSQNNVSGQTSTNGIYSLLADVQGNCDGNIRDFSVPFAFQCNSLGSQSVIQSLSKDGIQCTGGVPIVSVTDLPIAAGVETFRKSFGTKTTLDEQVRDGLAPIPVTADRTGQSDQLYRRMQETLDHYYGTRAAWTNDPNAKIDIVTHSQGGLITRMMIDKYTDNTLANPVNHINRIVNYDTPHFGSALAVDDGELANGAVSPENSHKTFAKFGQVRKYLVQEDFPGGVHVNKEDAITVDGWEDPDLKINLTGPVLGPYKGSIKVIGSKPFAHVDWNNFEVGVSWFTDEIPMDSIENSMGELRNELNVFQQTAKYLSWSNQPGSEQTLKKVVRFNYPVNYYSGEKIEMNNLYSPSSSLLVSKLLFDFWDNKFVPRCIDFMKNQDSHVDKTTTCTNVKDELLDEFVQSNRLAVDVDDDWSTHGDFVVESASQRGIIPSTDYDPTLNPSFKVHELPQSLHFNLGVARDMGIPSAHSRVCDGLGALGLGCGASAVSASTVNGFQIAASTIAPSVGDTGPSMDFVESKIVPATTPGAFAVALRLQKRDLDTSHGVAMEYYVSAISQSMPVLKTISSNVQAQLIHVKNDLYKVQIRDTVLRLSRHQTSPEYVVELSYANGNAWNASNDWSRPKSSSWKRNSRIAAGLMGGAQIKSYIPELSDSAQTVIPYKIALWSKERTLDSSSQLQPSLKIQNLGEKDLNGLRIRYYVRSATCPAVRTYWMNAGKLIPTQMVKLDSSLCAVELVDSGSVLRAGQQMTDIDFEINNADWSKYEPLDDPSYIVGNSQTKGAYVLNPAITVYDRSGQLVWGRVPSGLDSALRVKSQAPVVTAEMCAQAIPTISTAQCGSYFRADNGKLYQCTSSAEGCGSSQSTGIYCNVVPVVYPYWGNQAWKELGECPQ